MVSNRSKICFLFLEWSYSIGQYFSKKWKTISISQIEVIVCKLWLPPDGKTVFIRIGRMKPSYNFLIDGKTPSFSQNEDIL